MGKNSAIGVLSFSVANRRRDFLLPSVAPSASLVWQRPASWFNSTPRFLAAQRSAVSSLGEEVAQREPLKGFPLDSFGNRGARPLWHPELPGTDSVTNRACSRTFEYWVVGSTTNLADPTRRKANFLWKFLCAGTAFSAMRAPSPIAARPARIFAEQKCLAVDETAKFAARQEDRQTFYMPVGTCMSERECFQKYAEDARLGRHCKSGTPRISKGPRPFCFRKSPEKTLPKGFLWATSS